MSSANQSMRSPTLQMPALLIQPPRLVLVPTSGLTGHDALRDVGRLAREVDEEAAEGLLGGGLAGVLAAEVGRDLGRGDGAHGAALEAAAGRLAQLGLGRAGGERAERVVRVLAELGRQLPVLLVVEQRGVVGGMALGRQRPALDRVGEDDARAVADGVGLPVAVEQAREVVAAEVAEGGEQIGVVEVVDVDLDALAQLVGAGARSSRWYSSLGIASMRARRSGRRARRGPYLTITVCQPAASNIAARRPAAMSGTTRSSDWRLRSTTHMTSPRRATIGSAIASQHAPSSSSASPISAIWRPPRGTSKWPAT